MSRRDNALNCWSMKENWTGSLFCQDWTWRTWSHHQGWCESGMQPLMIDMPSSKPLVCAQHFRVCNLLAYIWLRVTLPILWFHRGRHYTSTSHRKNACHVSLPEGKEAAGSLQEHHPQQMTTTTTTKTSILFKLKKIHKNKTEFPGPYPTYSTGSLLVYSGICIIPRYSREFLGTLIIVKQPPSLLFIVDVKWTPKYICKTQATQVASYETQATFSREIIPTT